MPKVEVLMIVQLYFSLSRWKANTITAKLRVKIVWPTYWKNRVFEIFERSFSQLLHWFNHQFLHKQRVGCMQYNIIRIKGEFDLIYSENLRKCVKFRTWKSLLSIILSYCTGFIYCKLGHTFLSFSSCYYCTFDTFYYCWLFRDISNVAYNISEPSNDKHLRKEGFACYENMICLFCNLSDVFICVSKSLLLWKYEGWSINSFFFSIGSLFMGGFTSFSVIIKDNRISH